MPTSIPANGTALAAALRARGMSEREASRAAGLSVAAFRQVIIGNGIHPSTPFQNVHAIVTAAGITWSELLDPDPDLAIPEHPATHLPDEARVSVLARVLTTARRSVPIEHLCIVLGYTTAQLAADLAVLAPRFAALGFTIVYGNNNAVALSRGTDPGGDHALNELARLHDADRSMSRSAANVLYRTYAGTLTERRATRQDRIDMAALTNRGALAAGAGPALSADATYSLMLDEDDTTTT